MKKHFEYFGFIVIAIASIFYFDRTSIAIKNTDDIMIKILSKKENTGSDPVEAIISGNIIIPGLSGYKVDVEESYKKMRIIGEYSDNYLVYKKILPKETIIDNRNRIIISGNETKKEVAIILVLRDGKYISFVDSLKEDISLFLESCIVETVKEKLHNKSNVLGTIGTNYTYDKFNYLEYNNMMKKQFNTTNYYCLLKSIHTNTNCGKYNNFTIYSKIIEVDLLKTTKLNLHNGSILIYEVNNSLIQEFPLIINFIKSKGYGIVKLNELLKE